MNIKKVEFLQTKYKNTLKAIAFKIERNGFYFSIVVNKNFIPKKKKQGHLIFAKKADKNLKI